MRAVVRIYDLNSGKEVEEKRTVVAGNAAKLWLGGLAIWCMARGYSLEIFHEDCLALADADNGEG